MNSRERVRLAINHKEPDKIPVDWGILNVSGIHEVAYRNLLKYLNREEVIKIHDIVQVLALPSEDILSMFEVDTRYIIPGPQPGYALEFDEEASFVSPFGTKYKKTGLYYESVEFPLGDCEAMEDLKKYSMPDPKASGRFVGLREQAKKLYETTEFALCGYPVSTLYCLAWSLRGYENFMLDTAADPEFANYILDMVLEYYMEFMDGYLSEVGDYIDIMWCGDDWGTQTGPLVRPEEFRTNVKPRIKKMIDFMKTKSRAKVGYHTCGSSYWCIGDLIDCGVDILQPIQQNAAEMGDLHRLKREYGKDIVFHGAMDNQGKFHLSADHVERDARYVMEALGVGGGYLFASGHNIQANCPPENIVRLFETCKKYGSYSK